MPNLKLKLTLLNTTGVPDHGRWWRRRNSSRPAIDLQLDVRDGGTYWSAGKGDAGKDLDIVMMRFNGKLDPNFNTQWFTSDQVGNWNWSRWRSPEFDRLTSQAGTELDPAKRAALNLQCQTLMAESGAVRVADIRRGPVRLEGMAQTGSDADGERLATVAVQPGVTCLLKSHLPRGEDWVRGLATWTVSTRRPLASTLFPRARQWHLETRLLRLPLPIAGAGRGEGATGPERSTFGPCSTGAGSRAGASPHPVPLP